MDAFNSTSVQRDAPTATAYSEPTRRARRTGKILLAEGNRLNQKVAVRILQKEGHQVTSVTNGKEVLAALLESSFDMILMNAEMREMSGFEATGIIRGNEATTGGHIPIVAMTSRAMQGDRCVRSGMDRYIVKPLDLQQLRQAVTSSMPPAADAGPAFDQATALSRVNGDQAFLCTLASMFLEDSQSMIGDIRAAIEQQDGILLARAAHKLKGAACPLCATAVIDSAQALESIGQSGDLASATAEYRRFETKVGRLLTELSELTLGPAGKRKPTPNIVAGPEEAIPCTA